MLHCEVMEWNGMSVIHDTINRYPKMANGGWCLAGNISVSGYNPVDLNDEFSVKFCMQKCIDGMQHMKADACLIGFGDYKAYDINERELKNHLPMFIRVNDKKFLAELHYYRRDQEIEKDNQQLPGQNP